MYAILNQLVRWALLLFSRQIIVQGDTKTSGPLLLVANHPNGFLDGIVIATRFRRPVFFLGRGDLFRHRFAWYFLKPFHVMPLYSAGRNTRLRALNDEGLQHCRKVWDRGGIVLIFAEGETKPEWGLRPLTKTAFRLSDQVIQQDGSHLLLTGAGIHYDPFRGTRKSILIRIGNPVEPERSAAGPGPRALIFQALVSKTLQDCLYAGPATIKPFFSPLPSGLKRWLLTVPAIAGWVIHAPLYLFLKRIINAVAPRAAFRESYLFLALFVLYPVYWTGINAVAWIHFHLPWLSIFFLLMPLWARCYILWRKSPG